MKNKKMNKANRWRKAALLITIVSALFLVLSPPYFGALLPLVFIIPIYMGVHRIKSGKKSGMYISLGILPLAFSVSFFWIKYFLHIHGNLYNEFVSMSSNYNVSISTSKILIMGSSFFGIVLAVLCVVSFIFIMANRKNFK